MQVASAHTNLSLFQKVIVPADGATAATVQNGDFGTSPFFEQLGQATACLCVFMWPAGCKAQERVKKLGAKKLGAKTVGGPRCLRKPSGSRPIWVENSQEFCCE